MQIHKNTDSACRNAFWENLFGECFLNNYSKIVTLAYIFDNQKISVVMTDGWFMIL